MRIDSTVSAALMHEPSDSTLLWDAVRVMTRLLRQAAAVPGARLLELEGMGHDLPRRVWPRVIDAIVDTAAEAKLPDTKGVVLPTLDQITKATDVITKGWPTVVGAPVGTPKP